MNIWIVNPYATLPLEPWREDRAQVLSKYLAKRGDNVMVWTSSFIHRTKEFRSTNWEIVVTNENVAYGLVPTSSYTSHISIKRVLFERTFAENFRKYSKQQIIPDIIILAEPALFFSTPVKEYAQRKNVKLIVDIIDLWPEIFHTFLPSKAAFLGKILFFPFYLHRFRLLNAADGIVSVTKSFLEIVSKRFSHIPKKVVYWGWNESQNLQIPNESNLENLYPKRCNEFWVIYAGTLGVKYDINLIINAARFLLNNYPLIKFIIAGAGELQYLLKEVVDRYRLTNVFFVGALNSKDLSYFFRNSDAALSTYVKNSTVSMPIKAFDYMSFGIPILNSLGGDIFDLIKFQKIGLQYEAENTESLCKAILYLYHEPEERELMSLNCLEQVKSFENGVQYEEYMDFIDFVSKS